MVWLIFAGYFIGWIVGARLRFINFIDNLSWTPDYDDRMFGGVTACLSALIWPLLIPFLWVTRPTPKQKLAKRRKELEKLEEEAKELARKYNLPLGMEQNEKKENPGSAGDRNKYFILAAGNRRCNTCGDSGLCRCL